MQDVGWRFFNPHGLSHWSASRPHIAQIDLMSSLVFVYSAVSVSTTSVNVSPRISAFKSTRATRHDTNQK